MVTFSSINVNTGREKAVFIDISSLQIGGKMSSHVTKSQKVGKNSGIIKPRAGKCSKNKGNNRE